MSHHTENSIYSQLKYSIVNIVHVNTDFIQAIMGQLPQFHPGFQSDMDCLPTRSTQRRSRVVLRSKKGEMESLMINDLHSRGYLDILRTIITTDTSYTARNIHTFPLPYSLSRKFCRTILILHLDLFWPLVKPRYLIQ